MTTQQVEIVRWENGYAITNEVENFKHAVKNEGGNLAAIAGPGCGKTALIMHILEIIHGNAAVMYFGKANADEASEKIKKNPNIDGKQKRAKTIQSNNFGAMGSYSRWKKLQMAPRSDDAKYRKLIKDHLDDMPNASRLLKQEVKNGDVDVYKPIRAMLEYVRTQLAHGPKHKVTNERCRSIARHFTVDLPVEDSEAEIFVLDAVRAILDKGWAQIPFAYDFTDMLWFTALENKLKPFPLDWVIVDEAQDLSPAQLACVKKCLKRGGRMIFVGDPDQAIMGFAGADDRSLEKIVTDLDCKEFPLSLTWRLPKSHVEYINERFTHRKLTAAPNAVEGSIEHIEKDDVNHMLNDGDMLICRTTAPLIPLCYSLISEGKPAQIVGRDIGENLCGVVESIAKSKDFRKNHSWTKFNKAVDSWLNQIIAREQKQSDDEEILEGRIQPYVDKADCIKIIWARGKNIQSAKAFRREVESIFSKNKNASIRLSTIHRSKGLEAERVFIYRPDLLPGPWARNAWQAKQEKNLEWVALSRSRNKLFFVHGQ